MYIILYKHTFILLYGYYTIYNYNYIAKEYTI